LPDNRQILSVLGIRAVRKNNSSRRASRRELLERFIIELAQQSANASVMLRQ